MEFQTSHNLISDFQFFASARMAQQPPEETGFLCWSKESQEHAAGISNTLQGQVLFSYGKLIRTRAEPSLLVATGVKGFVISNAREKSGFWLFKRTVRSKISPVSRDDRLVRAFTAELAEITEKLKENINRPLITLIYADYIKSLKPKEYFLG